MNRRSAGSLVVLLLVAGGIAAAADPPRPRAARNLWPATPAKAREADVRGDVPVRVAVRPDGTVADVEILEVPEPGVGIEEAVRHAVEGWTFEPDPSREDPRFWEGSVPLVDPIDRPVARMFSVESAAVRGAIRRVLDDRRIRLQEDEHEIGWMVTEWIRVGGHKTEGLTFESDLLDMKPTKIRLYAFVPPWSEPGRVYLNSEVELKLRGETGTGYNLGDAERWLLDAIAADLAEPGHPVPSSLRARRRLDAWLAEPPDTKCIPPTSEDPRPAGLFGVPSPELIERTKLEPPYPAGAQNQRREGQIFLATVINSDGVVQEVEMIREFGGDPDFLTSAKRATQFWRYRPATMDGCPIDVRFTIHMEFSIR